MRELLLGTFLLSTVTSEHFAAKDRHGAPARAPVESFWTPGPRMIPGDGYALDPGFDEFWRRPDDTRPGRNARSRQALPYALIRQRSNSFDLRELFGGIEGSGRGCISSNCRAVVNQGWKLQEPFYVEEPAWVEIDVDYVDTLTQVNKEDPFFVTRGKKIYRLKGTEDRTNEKEREGREEAYGEPFADYGGERAFARGRRSLDSSTGNGRSRKNVDDCNEKDSSHRELNSRYIDNLVRHIQMKDDPFFVSRGKKTANLTANYSSTMGLREKVQRVLEHRAKERRSVNGVNRQPIESDETGGEFRDAGSRIGENNERKKRDTCSDRSCTEEYSTEVGSDDNRPAGEYELIKDVAKAIRNLDYVNRRDKHSDVLDILEEPFFISRGKKTFPSDAIARKNRDRVGTVNDYGERTARIVELNFLESLMRRINYTADKRIDDPERIAKRNVPRDRRTGLGDLLSRSEPYYAARGKRMDMNDFSNEKPYRTTRGTVANSEMSFRSEATNSDVNLSNRPWNYFVRAARNE